jgi:hypothetical protein
MVTRLGNIDGYVHYVVDSQNVGDTINFVAKQHVRTDHVSFTVIDFESRCRNGFENYAIWLLYTR